MAQALASYYDPNRSREGGATPLIHIFSEN